jgi:aspartyl protease family protein
MKALWLLFAALGIAAIILILNHDAGTSFGLGNNDFARFAFYAIWGVLLGAAILPGRGQWREAARNAILWIAIVLVLITGYLYRYELQDVASRITGGLIAGSPISAQAVDGRQQVTLIQGRDQHFTAIGEIDGVATRFVVDTGASAVVLTARDAEQAGIDTSQLVYDIPVATANGRTTAARVRLQSLAIGDIVRDDVSAMIAREGALEQSLLGMTFLSSLTSFEFRGDRLILTD